MSLGKYVEIPNRADHRGGLVVFEGRKEVPFEIKRVYAIHKNLPTAERGLHAHKTLKQLFVCLVGQCEIILDNGYMKQSYLLSDPTKGLLIDKILWRELRDFSEDCVLLVFADQHYDETDYIRNYENFKEFVKS